MAQKWPTTWYRQDGCAVTAYRFTRRKLVLLQCRPRPKESVPWSSLCLRCSEQRRDCDQQKRLSLYSRFEVWCFLILKGQFTWKWKSCQYLLTVLLFKNYMPFVVLWNMSKDILTNVLTFFFFLSINKSVGSKTPILMVSSHINSPVWPR